MKTSTSLGMLLVAGLLSAACSSQSNGGPPGSGGSSSSGGSVGNGSGGNSSSSGGKVGSGGNSSSSGGSVGTDSGGSTGSGGSCPNVTACGGTVTGTWTAMTSCLKVSGQLDLQATFGLSCASAPVSGSLMVSGSWTAKSDGTFMDGTTTTGTLQLALSSDCKILSKAPVTCAKIGDVMSGGYFSTATCTDDSASGGCACTGMVNQMGTMGVASIAANTEGNYSTASNTIKIDQDSSTTYSYCVSGSKLTVTPQSTGVTMAGTVVLTNGTSTGSGGVTGSGGSGKAGNSGSGGMSSSDGNSSSGGMGAGGKVGSGGTTPAGGATGSGGTVSTGRTDGPCDIYAAASVPCGAAYSMVRALSKSYTGPLYQIRIGSSSTNTGTGGTLKDILMLPDGYADISGVDSSCSGMTCTVATLYDQSGNKNDLKRGSAGPSGNGTRSGNDDYESTVKTSVTAGGHKVYVLYMNQYEGYRTPLNVKGTGLALNNADQGIYELADGTHFGTQCCWDFGSVSPDPNKYVTMNTLFFGKGFWGSGAGTTGPWFMGDFEGGVWAGGTNKTPGQNTMNPALAVPFAMGVLHTPVGKYALRMADTATATDLTTAYDGAIVDGKTWGNAGGIALGIGGDNSNNSYGTFYEGAMTKGSPSNATDLLILKNIQAVGYKK